MTSPVKGLVIGRYPRPLRPPETECQGPFVMRLMCLWLFSQHMKGRLVRVFVKSIKMKYRPWWLLLFQEGGERDHVPVRTKAEPGLLFAHSQAQLALGTPLGRAGQSAEPLLSGRAWLCPRVQ